MITDLNLASRLRLNNGTQIPRLGLGVWQIPDGPAAEQAVAWALETGYRHIDTAKYYGNEASVGRAVRASQVPRSDIWVTTKIWPGDYLRFRAAFEDSFQKLDLEYIDLYLIHWPSPLPIPSFDKKLWRQMEKLIDEGLVKTIGVSNYMTDRLAKTLSFANIPPAINQVKCSVFEYPRELYDFCQSKGVAFEAYSPLERGHRFDDTTLNEIASKYHKTPAQIMLRWNLQKNMVVIPKSAHQARIVENSQLYDFTIDEADMRRLDDLGS